LLTLETDAAALGRKYGAALLVRIEGEVDVHTSRLLAEQGAEIDGSPVTWQQVITSCEWREVAFDLQDVSFMDAAGLRWLQTLRHTAKTAGMDTRIVNPSRPVRKIMGLCGVRN
jgi:anti-anti-sigma factor